MTARGDGTVQLSNAEIAQLQTYRFQRKLDARTGLRPQDWLLVPPQVLRPIRPMINPEREKMMASGPCRMMTWGAPGDGSYTTKGMDGDLDVRGRQGAAALAGAAAASLIMNAASARKAKKDAEPRWLDFIPQGTLTVGSHGFYVEERERGPIRWPWASLTAVEWTAPSAIEMSIGTQSWSGRVALMSDWAELVLVGWISAAYPQHPGQVRVDHPGVAQPGAGGTGGRRPRVTL